MKIEIASEMIGAFLNGQAAYTPTTGSTQLENENGDTGVTLRNLDLLINEPGCNRIVLGFNLRHGQVLVIFATGETYLATGFAYGSDDDKVREFSIFAEKHGIVRSWKTQFSFLSAIDKSHAGPMEIAPPEFPCLADHEVVESHQVD